MHQLTFIYATVEVCLEPIVHRLLCTNSSNTILHARRILRFSYSTLNTATLLQVPAY